jgi:hypothetical protein
MLRTNALAHPNFDKAMPRKARFVTTGRLVGGAALDAQEYREHLAQPRESEFVTWDRDTLVEMLAVNPVSLSGSPLSLLQILETEGKDLNFDVLEVHSRGWIRSGSSPSNLRDLLEAAVIASHCRKQRRIDLACYLALMSLHSTFATVHGTSQLPETAAVAIDTARALFRYYATQLWESCRGRFLQPDELIQQDRTPASFLSYPVRCLTLLEIIALLALLVESTEPLLCETIAEYLTQFVQANAGVHSFLLSAVTWIADRYDEGNLGLAGPYSSPTEEANRLLGPPYEHVSLRRRSESYVASLILDLASVLEDQELYDAARNEFLAVDIVLPVMEVDNDLSQFGRHLGEPRFEPYMPYDEYWTPQENWKTAPHHKRGATMFFPEQVATAWDQLALSSVLRDRHFVYGWRRILGKIA